MSEVLSMTEGPSVQQVFVPPPSRFGRDGFAALAAGAGVDNGTASDDRWLFAEAGDIEPLPAEAAPQHTPTEEPVSGPRPARAVNWRDFDQIVLGPDSGDLSLSPVAEPYERMARASLVISLLGVVTGVGFLVGAVMGQIALRRMGRAGWFECNEPARRRARNAVMVGCTGMAILAAAALLIAGWWLVQTPLETFIPGLDAGGTAPAASAVTEGPSQ